MHSKEKLEKLDKNVLISMVLFLLAITKRRNKKAYKEAEHLGGLNPRDHFKSMLAYRKYQTYIHIHNIPHRHHRIVYIAGRRHKVECPNCRRSKRRS